MATLVTRIVDPDNGPGTHYTSLDAWEDDFGDTTSGNLVTADEIANAQCRNSSGSADTLGVYITGWTTGTGNYILIEAYSGYQHSGVWDDAKYRLVRAGQVIQINEDYVYVDGIQLEINSATQDYHAVIFDNAWSGADHRFSNLIIRNTVSGGSTDHKGIIYSGTNATVLMWNCVIYGFIDGANSNAAISFYGAALTMYNCTVAGNNLAVYRSSGSVTLKNCAVFNNSDDFSGTIVCDYCVSDDADASTYTNGIDWDAESVDWAAAFTDYAANDYSLKTGSDLIGAGIDDPGSGLYSDDIAGNARSSPWDIGAFEYVASGGIQALAGVIAAQSAASGALSPYRGLAGVIDGQSGVSGAMGLIRDLAGTIAAQSGLSADLLVGSIQALAGVIAAQSGLSAALSPYFGFAGSIAAQSALSGQLIADLALSGATAGQSGASAALGLIRDLAGTIAAQSGLSADLLVGSIQDLVGEISAQSGVSGVLTPYRWLAGAVAGQSGVAGALSPYLGLVGSIAAQSGLAGQLIADLALSGAIAGQSGASAALGLIRDLAGTIAVQSGLSARLIAGDLLGVITDSGITSLSTVRGIDTLTALRALVSATVKRAIETT